MKYYLGLFISLFLLAGCDDGDLITENFNFSTVQVQKCTTSNSLYKLNAIEALILNIDETNFPNITTAANTPTVISITATGVIQYRKYSGSVNAASICDSPAPSNPVVLEEWNVSGGKIEITTTEVFDATGTTVIAYNHNIVFKNINFIYEDKQIAYDTYDFGDYRTQVIILPFNFASANTIKCTTNNLIFRYSDKEVLLLDIDPTLFLNEATAVGVPREKLIDNATNKVIYRVYNGSLNANFFCSSITPTSPLLSEEWIAENGIDSTSGIIKVETVALDLTTYEHTIKLYKTNFKNGIKQYSPAPNGDYIFGTYRTIKI
jgi:hypothetical protein